MPLHLHVVEDVGNLAVRANHKCGACDSLHFSAIHVFFFDHAKGFADLLISIGQQGVGQVIFVLEFLLGLRQVGRDPKDDRAGFLQILVCVTELGRLDGSPGCVGFGKEKQDHAFASKILQRHIFAVLVRQRKVWGLIIDIHEGFSVSFTVIPDGGHRRHAGRLGLDIWPNRSASVYSS